MLPLEFFDILLYNASNPVPCSLSQSSNEIFKSFGISISKQAYDERFDQTAVDFVKCIIEEELCMQLDGSIDPGFLKKFTRVRIKDSTRFDLPERLKEHFKGFGGGCASASGACVQFEYDLRNNQVLDLVVTDARSSDSREAKAKLFDIKEGELVIRDLGYFSLEVIEKIIKEKAYFISRLNTQTIVYGQSGEELSFRGLYRELFAFLKLIYVSVQFITD